MAQAINKYVWLVDTIRKAGDHGITIEDINKKWLLKDNVELSGGVEIPKRTFHKWRNIVEKMFNITIDCRRKGGYRYYIANPQDLNGHGLSNWLLDTVSVSNLLMRYITLKDRILLESVPSGLQFLPDILDAMSSSQVIDIIYQGYWHDSPQSRAVHPYCVKLFKQRWYMVAYKPQEGVIRTYAVDRIKGINRKQETFVMPAAFDPEVFFRHAYGVMIGNRLPQNIKIKVEAFQANYLRSLPLHRSQQEILRNDEYSIFTCHLCPEFDFMMELLSMGDTVEVLEPAALRDEIATIAHNMNENYQPKSRD